MTGQRRAALVTGSTSGIGLAIARKLLALGYDVVVHGIEPESEISPVIADLEAAGGRRPLYFRADLAEPAHGFELVNDTIGALGRIDVLVNNAGIQKVSPIADFPPVDWDRVRAISLDASFHTIRAAVPDVNAICPGYVWTPLVARQVADQAKVHGLSEAEVIRTIMLAQQPTRRFVQPEEIAELAAYLCGDLARSITGSAISIDGGWTAR